MLRSNVLVREVSKVKGMFGKKKAVKQVGYTKEQVDVLISLNNIKTDNFSIEDINKLKRYKNKLEE